VEYSCGCARNADGAADDVRNRIDHACVNCFIASPCSWRVRLRTWTWKKYNRIRGRDSVQYRLLMRPASEQARDGVSGWL